MGNRLQTLAFLFVDPGANHDRIVPPDVLVSAFTARWAQAVQQNGWDNSNSQLNIVTRYSVERRLAGVAQSQVRRSIKQVARPGVDYAAT